MRFHFDSQNTKLKKYNWHYRMHKDLLFGVDSIYLINVKIRLHFAGAHPTTNRANNYYWSYNSRPPR